MHRFVLPGCALVLLAGLACDETDPFEFQWIANPDTVLLYSLARPELNLYSAADLVNRKVVRVASATGSGEWDIALDTEEGGLVLRTPSSLGIESEAGIAVFPGSAFDDVEEAPEDSAAYAVEDPVDVALGTVYVVRTREVSGTAGVGCSRYAKLEPLIVDLENQTLTFVYDTNPDCDDRNLVADEAEEEE